MSECPQDIQFFEALQLCGVEVPEDVVEKTEITCDDWLELLPAIHKAILNAIGKAGTVSNLEMERVDYDKKITTLQNMVKFIEETCGTFTHIHVVDDPVDECCPDYYYD